jgi:phospholipase A-2-activating protein
MSSQQQSTTTDYILSAELKDHSDQVRCATAFTMVDGALVTGSLDRTLKIWEPKKDFDLQYQQYQQILIEDQQTMSDNQERPKRQPPTRYSCTTTLIGHNYFVSDVVVIPPSQNDSNGSIVSVSHDKSIIVWSPSTGSIVKQFQGAHDSAITSISVDPNNNQRWITGSWDKTAKIWLNGECVNVLEGHTTNVLCVLFLSNGDIVTGSGDGTIKIWDQTGTEVKSITASTTCVRGLCEYPGIGFLSVANDGMLKTWTLQGYCVHEQPIHSNLVYSVIVTKAGEIVTASEDKTVKVWKNAELVQTIEHPACVWQVVELPNGDIATACADCVARVFTRKQERVANQLIIQAFDDAVTNSKVKKGSVDTNTLPTSGALQTPGKKSGEVKLVNNNGLPEAWSWNADERKWEKMGDVVEGPGVGGGFAGKIYYEGDMYDYVFDIELEQPGSGAIKFKLPYNNGGNPFVSAQDFIWKHELPQYYLDQIARFIVQNSDQSAANQNAMDIDDPFTGNQTYMQNPNRPQQQQPSKSSDLTGYEKEQLKQQKVDEERNRQRNITHFPSGAVMFDAANTDGIVKKVKEFNDVFKKDGQAFALNDAELKLFNDWISALKSLQYNGITASHFAILDQKLLKWPAKNLFPVIDLMRLIILTPVGAKHYAQEVTKGRDILRELLDIVQQNKADNILNMLFIRFAANIFVHNAFIGLKHASELVDIVNQYKKTDNKNIQNAVITLVLNLCVQFRMKQDPIQDTLLGALADLFEVVVDHEMVYRLLVAAGTLLEGNLHLLNTAMRVKIDEYAQQHISSPTGKVHGAAFRLKQLFAE